MPPCWNNGHVDAAVDARKHAHELLQREAFELAAAEI
jgi:hypothetical protein